MPPVETVGYLLRYLFEIGPAASNGMGLAAIAYQEIAAWQELSGVQLRPWEAKWLRSLSRTYVSELHKAEAPDCAAPWHGEGFVHEQRAATAMALRRAIAAMANGD